MSSTLLLKKVNDYTNSLKNKEVADVSSKSKHEPNRPSTPSEREVISTNTHIAIQENLQDLFPVRKKEGTEEISHKKILLQLFNPDCIEECEQLESLRNQTIIRGYDVICAMLAEQGIIYNDPTYGRPLLEGYGGLMSYVALDALKKLFGEDIHIAKNSRGITIGAYITTPNVSLNIPPTDQEQVALGDSLGNIIQSTLICSSEAEQEARKKALYAIMESQVALCANLCTDKHYRKRGVATVEKALTFQHCLRQGINKGILSIFSIEGVYTQTTEGKFIQVYKFDPPIENTGSFSLNRDITQRIGYVPIYKQVTKMIDNLFSEEQTRKMVSKLLGIPLYETDKYYVRIDDIYYLTNFIKAIPYLTQTMQNKELFDHFEIAPEIRL